MVRQEGFEPPAYCLEGSCSIQLSYWRELNGAGDGNRTRIPSLEGWCPSHCATPACALRKNRQLCYNSISVPFCQRFFGIFLHFLCYLSRARKSLAPSALSGRANAPHSRSGCHCTAKTGSVLWPTASTVPSSAQAKT